MASSLQDLLPRGVVGDVSQSDVVQQLVSATAAVSSALPGAAGGGGAALQEPVKDVTDQLTSLATQLVNLNSTQQTQIGATQDNTQAVNQNTSDKGGSSVASTIGSVANGLLGGLSLSPILSGIIRLFTGGSDTQTAVAPVPFALPAPVQFQAGLTGSSPSTVVPVDYGQRGQVRPAVASPSAQVNIQVTAMDSRSFLDHSAEIASAVREAILNSNSINDAISDI